jgi:predicted ABC-type exoprotein transport system permease subunit
VLLILSLVNFVTIQYAFVVRSIPEVSRFFPNLVYFGFVLVLVYGPLSTLLGFLDYKAGSIPRESAVNPYTRDLAKALQLIAQGRNQEASELLDPWTEETPKARRKSVPLASST